MNGWRIGRQIIVSASGGATCRETVQRSFLKEAPNYMIYQLARHSNLTICNSLSGFCPEIFPSFEPSYWEANSFYPRGPIMGKGSSSKPKSEWDRGFSVPGTFKLDHLHPFKPLLFWKISIFFTFILGGQFLLPQRANNGKREFTQLQKWMRQRVFSAWGIQTGPFAAHSAHFVQKDLQLLDFHTRGPTLITPED